MNEYNQKYQTELYKKELSNKLGQVKSFVKETISSKKKTNSKKKKKNAGK